MTYNLTNYTAATNLLDMGVAANQTTGGLLGGIILLIIFCALFFSFNTQNTMLPSLVNALGIVSVVAFAFRIVNFVNDLVMWSTWILFLICLAASFFFSRE